MTRSISVTPALLSSSSNSYVKYLKSVDWQLGAATQEEVSDASPVKSNLSAFLMDMKRGGFYFGDLHYPAKTFTSFTNTEFENYLLNTVKFTAQELRWIAKGHNQDTMGLGAALLNTGLKNLIEKANGNEERYSFAPGKVREYRFDRQDASLKFAVSCNYQLRRTSDEGDKSILFVDLPTIKTACVYSDETVKPKFVSAEVPELYLPLLFHNENFDFLAWYQSLDPVNTYTFSRKSPFILPGLLLGEKLPTESLSVNQQNGDTLSADLSARFNDDFVCGDVFFLNLEQPKGMENVKLAQDKAPIVYQAIQNFIKTLPSSYFRKVDDNELTAKDKIADAIQSKYLEIYDCLSKDHKGLLKVGIYYDINEEAIVFEARRAHEFVETETIAQAVEASYLNNAAGLLQEPQPEREAFTGKDPEPENLKISRHLELPKVTEPNHIYIYRADGAPMGRFLAKYIDEENKSYDAIEVKDESDELLVSKHRAYLDTFKLVQKATFAYRQQRFKQRYLEKMVQDGRKYQRDELKKAFDEIGPALFRSYNELSKIYDQFETYNSDKISDGEWRRFVLSLANQKQAIKAELTQLKAQGMREQYSDIVNNVDQLWKCISIILLRGAKNTAEANANEKAVGSAWANELSHKETLKVLMAFGYQLPGSQALEGCTEAELQPLVEAVPGEYQRKVSRFITEDPRRILLFIKKTHLSDALFKDWDDAYLPLQLAEYKAIDDLNKSLQEYRQNRYALALADRKRAVQGMLIEATAQLNNPALPAFLIDSNKEAAIDAARQGQPKKSNSYLPNRSPLSQLVTGLENELNYLLELEAVRKASPQLQPYLSAQEETQNTEQPAQPNVIDIEGEPATVESDVTTNQAKTPEEAKIALQSQIYSERKKVYRQHLLTRQGLRDYATLVLETEAKLIAVEDAVKAYLVQKKVIKEGDPIPASFDDLDGLSDQQIKDKKIESAALIVGLIKKFRERHGADNARTGLEYVEDYEAIITAIHAVVDRNNKKARFYQSNRFNDIIGEALGKKPRSRFKEQPRVALSPAFALEVAEYEKSLHDKRQEKKLKLFRREFKEETACLKEVASVDAMIASAYHLKSFLQRIAAAKDTNALTEVDIEYDELLGDHSEQAEQEASQRRFKAAYAKTGVKPKAQAMLKLLNFSKEIHAIYLSAIGGCESAKSVEALQQLEKECETDLRNALPADYQASIFEKAYGEQIKIRQDDIKRKIADKIAVIRADEMLSWNEAMQQVITPAIEEIQTMNNETAILKYYKSALNQLNEQYTTTKKGYLFSQKAVLARQLLLAVGSRLLALSNGCEAEVFRIISAKFSEDIENAQTVEALMDAHCLANVLVQDSLSSAGDAIEKLKQVKKAALFAKAADRLIDLCGNERSWNEIHSREILSKLLEMYDYPWQGDDPTTSPEEQFPDIVRVCVKHFSNQENPKADDIRPSIERRIRSVYKVRDASAFAPLTEAMLRLTLVKIEANKQRAPEPESESEVGDSDLSQQREEEGEALPKKRVRFADPIDDALASKAKGPHQPPGSTQEGGAPPTASGSYSSRVFVGRLWQKESPNNKPATDATATEGLTPQG